MLKIQGFKASLDLDLDHWILNLVPVYCMYKELTSCMYKQLIGHVATSQKSLDANVGAPRPYLWRLPVRANRNAPIALVLGKCVQLLDPCTRVRGTCEVINRIGSWGLTRYPIEMTEHNLQV
eukprot:SAG31_NODE_25079_length_468_cov_0.956640_1_plen_121_part_01